MFTREEETENDETHRFDRKGWQHGDGERCAWPQEPHPPFAEPQCSGDQAVTMLLSAPDCISLRSSFLPRSFCSTNSKALSLNSQRIWASRSRASLITTPDSFQVGRLIGSYGFMNITRYYCTIFPQFGCQEKKRKFVCFCVVFFLLKRTVKFKYQYRWLVTWYHCFSWIFLAAKRSWGWGWNEKERDLNESNQIDLTSWTSILAISIFPLFCCRVKQRK